MDTGQYDVSLASAVFTSSAVIGSSVTLKRHSFEGKDFQGDFQGDCEIRGLPDWTSDGELCMLMLIKA